MWISSESELIPYHAVDKIGQGSALVLAPHPDDEVLGCAGAILRHVAMGDPIRVIILTDGGGWQPEGVERTAYMARRRQESREAAIILGYGEPEFWEYRDRELRCDERLIQRLCQAVAGARWLYAPSPYELHPDHRALALATLEVARRLAGPINLALYEVGSPLPPNRLLNITDLAERKRQALACFASQLATQAYDRHIEALNRFRTYTLPRGIEAAEAYWVIEGNEVARILPATQATVAAWWRMAIAPMDNAPMDNLVGTMGNITIEDRARELQAQQEAYRAAVTQIDQEWRDRHEAILHSRSWRLTAPLRAAARWVRAGRDRLAELLTRWA